MASIAVLQKLDSENAGSILRELGKDLKRAQGEVVIDLSSVGRLEGNALQALKDFLTEAEAASVKVKLSGVNVVVYKVLVLMKLNSRFSFVN